MRNEKKPAARGKRRGFRRALWALAIVIGAPVVAFGLFLLVATVGEYRPKAVEPALFTTPAAPRTEERVLREGDALSFVTYNIGYASLGRDSDYFMDGGTMVQTPKSAVEGNLRGIIQTIGGLNGDVTFVQEADYRAMRSYRVNQFQRIAEESGAVSASFATNFKSLFTPYPIPPIGQVHSGVVTLSKMLTDGKPQRHALPVPFNWPVRLFNLKRCMLVSRIPLADSERELVAVNVHCDAYESGGGREAQTRALLGLMQSEYEKGNYVVAGGDFNQLFPGKEYPALHYEIWQPNPLDPSALPEGFRYVSDNSVPTCRLLNEPYSGNPETTQFYVIDGFILSPNVAEISVETQDVQFQYADHQPVKMEVRLGR